MSRSMKDLELHGIVSPKASRAYNATLAQTRAQPSKMTNFDNKAKLEGKAHNYGDPVYNEDHLLDSRTQRASKSVVRKPRSDNRTGTKQRQGYPSTRHINTEQGPKFPSGASYHSKATAGRNSRMKGTIAQTGPMYGGGGRNTQ